MGYIFIVCLQSLPIGTDVKKTENEVLQPATKSKRRGRRKKKEPKSEVQNSPVLNGPAKPKSARKKYISLLAIRLEQRTSYLFWTV